MAQLTSQFLRFVKTLIKYEFGENVAKIADTLLVYGPQTQQQIVKNSGLEKDEIKKGLIVFLAYGIAFVQLSASGGGGGGGGATQKGSKKRPAEASIAAPAPTTGGRVDYIYEFDVEKARLRASAVWHVQILKQNFGKDGALIGETFVQHGKLLKSQLLSIVVTKRFAAEGDGEQPSESALEQARENVQSVFKSMLEQKYIQSATTLPTTTSAAATLGPASKRAHTENDDGGGHAATGYPDEDSYWMLNFDKLRGELVRMDVVDHVRAKLCPAAASMVDVMMKQPAPLTKQQINDHVKSLVAPKLTAEAVQEYLEELVNSNLVILDGATYSVAVYHILSQLRAQHALSIVSGSFEALGGSIFRLLLQHHRLEEKQVIELSTAPKQKVRAVLTAMLKRGLVSLQEVPKTPDRHPSRTFYLWGVPSEQVSRCLLDSFCGSWANVRLRLAAETAKIKAVHDKIDLNGSDSLNESEVEQFNKWKRADDRMQHSLLQLDRLITLFRD